MMTTTNAAAALLWIAALSAGPDEVVGTWAGTLDAGGQKIKLILRVEKQEDGSIRGRLDVPTQGAAGLPLDACTYEEGVLEFVFRGAGFRYEGTRTKDGSAFEGTFHQAGLEFPLTLRRGTAADEPKRPQTPKPPFPYDAIDVTYPSAPGVTLAGTLTVPKGKGPFPALVLVTGSGPQDRDETLFGHKPFLVIADHLARNGIAVLRFDDRGFGKSTGDLAKATSKDFAVDAAAGVAFLRTRGRIDPDRIGVGGHSEGGMVAPMVAVEDPRVAFVVMLAGTGVPGDELLIRQAEVISQAARVPEAAITANRMLQEKIFKAVREEADDAKRADRIREILKGLMTPAQVEQQVRMSASPWMRFFLDHDPRPVLKKLACPVLAINGRLDLQVDPKQNLPEIEKALAGKENVRIMELAELNHLFQPAKTGLLTEYGQIETTFSPRALEIISDWIREQTAR